MNGIISIGGVKGIDPIDDKGGALYLFPASVSSRVGNSSSIRLEGNSGHISVGKNGKAGQIVLFPATVTNPYNWHQSSFRLEGDYGHLIVGGNGKTGDLLLFPGTTPTGIATDNNNWKQSTIHLSAGDGNIRLGGNGWDGDLLVFPSTSDRSSDTEATIHLDGNAGDITLRGADCAEYFAVSEPQTISPGTVLIIESEDMLIPSQFAYDKRVVGVVSGAGNYKPGILLGKDDKEQGLPIALNGKVYCNVDTSNGAINVGDLLTTSSTSGHAMKADDPMKSFGAIIGKALKPLSEGRGLIPILVALQ